MIVGFDVYRRGAGWRQYWGYGCNGYGGQMQCANPKPGTVLDIGVTLPTVSFINLTERTSELW